MVARIKFHQDFTMINRFIGRNKNVIEIDLFDYGTYHLMEFNSLNDNFRLYFT